jgi:hypothetical protein
MLCDLAGVFALRRDEMWGSLVSQVDGKRKGFAQVTAASSPDELITRSP